MRSLPNAWLQQGVMLRLLCSLFGLFHVDCIRNLLQDFPPPLWSHCSREYIWMQPGYFSACKWPPTHPKMKAIGQVCICIIYQSIIPARPRAQPKWSHFFGAHALISSWSPCQLCTCISSLHNEAAKFSWLPPVHPWFIRVCKERVGGGCRKLYTLHCKERVGGGCRKLFASCGSAHQTSIQALQPPLASISTSHQSWWTNLPTPFIPSL